MPRAIARRAPIVRPAPRVSKWARSHPCPRLPTSSHPASLSGGWPRSSSPSSPPLGAIAVLVTGVLGYMRARDALLDSIYNQLTAARKSKARQVETYIRTIRTELSQLANAKDDGRCRAGLPRRLRGTRPDRPSRSSTRRDVGDWYRTEFMPEMRRVRGEGPPTSTTTCRPAPPPTTCRTTISSTIPTRRTGASWSTRCRRRQRLQPPACRSIIRCCAGAATAYGFFDVMLADAKSGRLVLTVAKEVDFATSLRAGPYPQNKHGRRRRALLAAQATNRPSASRTSRPYAPSRGAPTAFMTAPVIDQGVVVAVLIAQLSIEEIDNVVTGDRRWKAAGGVRRHRRGLSHRPDRSRTLRPASLRRESRAVPFIELEAGRRHRQEYRCHPPLRHAGHASACRHRGRAQGALAGIEGTGEYRRVSRCSPRSPPRGRCRIFPASRWGLIAKIDSSRPSRRSASCSANLMIVGGIALLVVVRDGRVAVTLAARAGAASSPPA